MQNQQEHLRGALFAPQRRSDAATVAAQRVRTVLATISTGPLGSCASAVKQMADYFFAGGKSVQVPCATSAAMPMLSPSVGWG